MVRIPFALLIGAGALTSAFFYFGDWTPKVEGKIDVSFYRRVAQLIEDDVDEIIVSSPGGEFYWALQTARLLQRADVGISIEGECLSACASVLMAATKDVEIAPGALIAFHRPIGAWVYINEYLVRSSGRSIEAFEEYETAREVLSLYRDSDLNPGFSIAAMYRQGIECIDVRGVEPAIKPGELDLYLRDDLYIPSKGMLSQFGWNLNGYPEGSELVSMGEAFSREYPEYSIRIEDPSFRFSNDFIEKEMEISVILDCF